MPSKSTTPTFGEFVSKWLHDMPNTMVEKSLMSSLKHVTALARSPRIPTTFPEKSPRTKKLDQEQEEYFAREFAARMQRHSLKFGKTRAFLQPGIPEEQWNLLKFDQSVNLFCLGEHQIDKVIIFEQCLPQDATVNRGHPLFSLPTAIRMEIYSFLIPATTRKISLSPSFATKQAFGNDYFDDPFTTLQHVCGALEAFRAIRHELMTYFWTQFHFHVTLTPFTGPKFSPLSSFWLVENLAIVQYLTLEVDFTKFGGGFLIGASEYGYQMEATDRMLLEISLGLSERRGTTIMTELNLLCRRYAGDRPSVPTEVSSSDVFGPGDLIEAMADNDYKLEAFDRLAGKLDRLKKANTGRGGNAVKKLEATYAPLAIEPPPEETYKVPYCPELPTLVCDSIRAMTGLIQRCRLSGFTHAYTELLLSALFEGEDEVPQFFVADDPAWPSLPTPSNDIESVFPRTKLRQMDYNTPSLSREPSFLRLKVGNLAASAINSLSRSGSTLGTPKSVSAPSPIVSSFDSSSRGLGMATDLGHSQTIVHSPGLKSKSSVASTVSTPGSPIAISDSAVASAHLHRSFSSSGLKYSSMPVNTSPLAHAAGSPAPVSFRSPQLPVTPRTPAFPRSRLSLRSSVRSPTAPHTPDTSYFPRSGSAMPSRSASPGTPTTPLFGPYTDSDAVHPSAFNLKLSRSRSFRTDFEEQMLKSTFNRDYNEEDPAQNDSNIIEQDETEDAMMEVQSTSMQKHDFGNWVSSDEGDDDEKNYATTPPRLDRSGDFDLGPDLVMAATPRSNHLDPHNIVEMTKTPKKMGRLTPICQYKGTLPNSPNTMNLLNEQDPAFVASLNVRRLDSIDIGSRSATPAVFANAPTIRPISYQHLKPDTSDNAGGERCVTSLNNRSNSTRKRYFTFVDKLRGRVEG